MSIGGVTVANFVLHRRALSASHNQTSTNGATFRNDVGFPTVLFIGYHNPVMQQSSETANSSKEIPHPTSVMT